MTSSTSTQSNSTSASIDRRTAGGDRRAAQQAYLDIIAAAVMLAFGLSRHPCAIASLARSIALAVMIWTPTQRSRNADRLAGNDPSPFLSDELGPKGSPSNSQARNNKIQTTETTTA
jgi:hypothetical protein